MTNQETLTKVIEIAVSRGWKGKGDSRYFIVDVDKCGNYKHNFTHEALDEIAYMFIYSHDFTKALWGEEPKGREDWNWMLPPWQYHLQQMVIADDPVAYLGEHLPE